MPAPQLKSRIIGSLPEFVQETLVGYGEAAGLRPLEVVEYTVVHFLDLKAQLPLDYKQHYGGDDPLLSELPVFLQEQIRAYAEEDEEMLPVDVIESALIFFQDPDAATFEECYPGVQQKLVQWLKSQREHDQFKAA